MEPDKDKITKLIQDILEDPKLKTLTSEELALILFHDAVEPLFKELHDHYAGLAWAYGTPERGRSN